MTKKVHRPKVKIPSSVKDAAMLSPSSRGRIDRQYIRAMASAIHTYNTHRNDNIRKITKEINSED